MNSDMKLPGKQLANVTEDEECINSQSTEIVTDITAPLLEKANVGPNDIQQIDENAVSKQVDEKTDTPEEAETQKRKDSHKSGLPGASFNLINSIIGAGIIGIPFAISRAGFILGFILLFVIGIATDYTMGLIVSTGLSVNVTTYEGLCDRAFGRVGFILITVFMLLAGLGFMLGYLVIIGDVVPRLMKFFLPITWGGYGIVTHRAFCVGMVSFVFMLPICLLKNLDALKNFSLLSISSVGVIVIAVGIRSGEYSIPSAEADDPYGFARPSFLAAMGTIAFAFTAHHLVFIVYESIRGANLTKWNIVVKVSVWTSVAACVVLGIIGYLTFFDTTEGNVLNNFPEDDIVISVARVLLALTMILTYPLYNYGCRYSLHALFFRKSKEKSAPMTNFQHYGLTILLWGATTGFALLVTDLGVVLELVGSTASTFLGYLMPILCYFKINGFKFMAKRAVLCWSSDSSLYKEKFYDRVATTVDFVSACVIFMFGVAVFFLGSILAFVDID